MGENQTSDQPEPSKHQWLPFWRWWERDQNKVMFVLAVVGGVMIGTLAGERNALRRTQESRVYY